MRHPERVEDYLEHVLEAIGRATAYLEPVPNLEAFRENFQVQDAIVRNIEIIGEAVTQIQRTAPDFIRQHSELAWTQMRAMRNIAIHGYFFLDLEIVWNTVKNDLPELKRQVDALLGR